MPVKFAVKISEAVDPNMPFVHNEQLDVKIINNSTGDTAICHFGDTSTDYRIDNQMYITNYKTAKKPAEYTVEIWRMNNNFLIGDFTFETVKQQINKRFHKAESANGSAFPCFSLQKTT